jgi:hypothetical protein
MGLLPFLQRHGWWLAWPVLGLGVLLLWSGILAVVRLADRMKLHTLRLLAEQEVVFAETGEVDLWLEGPLLSGRFARLTFELNTRDGTTLEGRRPLSRLRSSGFSKGRMVGRVFTIPHPGRYVLHTRGLGAAQPRDEEHSLIFMRPYFPQVVACILGMILGAFLLIGGILIFITGVTTMKLS